MIVSKGFSIGKATRFVVVSQKDAPIFSLPELLDFTHQPELKKPVDTVREQKPFRTTAKPWETMVCWYLRGNHHSGDS